MRRSLLRHGILLSSLGSLAACASSAPKSTAGSDAQPLEVTIAHRDDASRPTFTRVFAKTPPATTDPKEAVMLALRGVLAAQGLDPAIAATASIDNLQPYGRGAWVAQLSQRIDGVEVLAGGVAIVLDERLEPVAVSGSLLPDVDRKATFPIAASPAVERAVAFMTGHEATHVAPMGQPHAGYVRFAVGLDPSTQLVVHSARQKPVWFSGKRLTPAHYVELDVGRVDETDSSMHALVVSAIDGSILLDHDLTNDDAFTYRVWAETSGAFTPWAGPHGSALTPHPTGAPDGTVITPKDSVLVSLENLPFSKNDPWLPKDATSTLGNNVTAYADLRSPDGFGEGDLRPATTAPLTFDHLYDTTKGPLATPANGHATATTLFYVANWLHDWFYDAGWNEAARNPQADNFGRGGAGNDRLRMEAQDYSGRNNANASTPADGVSPRIQMFIFNGTGSASLSVTAPSAIAGPLIARTAAFGPANFDVTGSVVLVDDGAGTKTDGCDAPLANAADLKGKIALVDRGNCPFTQKVQNAEAAGAVGTIVANNVTGPAMSMGGTPGTVIKIPSLAISLADGDKIKAQLASGVTVKMFRETALDRDGGLDIGIVAHEWGHVLSNRLIGNAMGLVNVQGRGMGEGWSDFVALLTMVKSSDVAAAEKNDWNGAYPIAGWIYGANPGGGSYFGMRRYPYSADFKKNPLTFKHIQNGTALPKDAPISFGEDGINNAEVHNTGEVWSAMLWQCYVNLLRDKPRLDYEEATKRMRQYLVAGMKATPVSPTILEARDALLAAIYAADKADFKLCAKGFAERGAGTGALGPEKTSRTNVGVKESFLSGNDFDIVSVTLEESAGCDNDGTLDNGETGTLTIKVRNTGLDELKATAGKVSAKTTALVFENEGKLTIPPTKPFETVEVKVQVTAKNAEPVSKQDIEVSLTDPTLVDPRDVVATLPVTVAFDIKPESSATDAVLGADTPWKPAGDGTLSKRVSWKRVTVAGDQRWVIEGNTSISDQWLVSPALEVSADRPLALSFRHRHAFERDSYRRRNYDGGVIEISTDDGATWIDIGEKVYTGRLETAENDNPLKGRMAFASRNASYPAFDTVKIDLGNAYAGKTVKVRFRAGTDDGTASGPWEIDDIAFSGITNTPFASRVPDANLCVKTEPTPDPPPLAAPPPDESGTTSCTCRTTGGAASSAGFAVASLAAIAAFVRRRRRA